MDYDLEGRTKKFSLSILFFVKTLKISFLNKNIISQIIKSATSVGANYCEANGAISGRDFANKIYLCKKEAKETKYWIELLAEIETARKTELRKIWAEANELTLIFGKIAYSLKNKNG